MTRVQFYGGRRPWAAIRGDLGGWTGLWQDRQGLRIEELPVQPPHSSWLWGWSPDRSAAVRMRLDADISHAAVVSLDPIGGIGEAEQVDLVVRTLHGWNAEQGQVRQYRGPSDDTTGLGADYLSIEIADTGDGGLVFFVPETGSDPRWRR